MVERLRRCHSQVLDLCPFCPILLSKVPACPQAFTEIQPIAWS